MKNKKDIISKQLKKQCTKKLKICTMRFCATGCLVENYDDKNIVCLEDVAINYTSGCRDTEYIDNICICDDHIIAFEAIQE